VESTATVREVYLKPGDFCFGEGMLRITTVLGSCVSITLWHPRFLHGGMCHYMLPHRQQPRDNEEPDGKYADEAMLLFMRELQKRNTKPSQYQVNLYGGGNMFSEPSPKGMDIGQQNIDIAHRLLKEYGFTVSYDHLGSFGRRKIEFDVWNGEVSLIHIDHRKTDR
jgi:chemotaxis protein CheD